MSRNAFPKIEREYARDLELRDTEKSERDADRRHAKIYRAGKSLPPSIPIVPAATITDRQRLDWLCDRVQYLEHRDRFGRTAHQTERGGYWPQDEFLDGSTEVCTTSIPEYHNLDLIDYIDAVITMERNT